MARRLATVTAEACSESLENRFSRNAAEYFPVLVDTEALEGVATEVDVGLALK
jgi:CBS-domain-containing membrane protein